MPRKKAEKLPPRRPIFFAGKEVTREQVRATLSLLRYYKRFLASEEHDRCQSPEQWGIYYTKDQARHRVDFLINNAINRKAGIPDETYDEQEFRHRLMRDAGRLRDIHRRIRVYQFETEIVRSRFGHLLSRYDD